MSENIDRFAITESYVCVLPARTHMIKHCDTNKQWMNMGPFLSPNVGIWSPGTISLHCIISIIRAQLHVNNCHLQAFENIGLTSEVKIFTRRKS